MTFSTLGVVGAGQMGTSIARLALTHGMTVVLVDSHPAARTRALETLRRACGKQTMPEPMLSVHPSLEALNLCDIVVEAVAEDEGLKETILKAIETVVPASAVLASNTSSLSIAALAACLSRPERFLGIHFMNPAHSMALVEVIPSPQLEATILPQVMGWLASMEKRAITCRDVPGFVVNRLLLPMINAAAYLLMEGVASAADIDQAMQTGAGHPMGPLRLADFIGLDTCLAILQRLHAQSPTKFEPPCPLFHERIAQGKLGQKTGEGFFQYSTTN